MWEPCLPQAAQAGPPGVGGGAGEGAALSQRISAACPGGLVHCGFALAPCQGWRPNRKEGEAGRDVANVSSAPKPPR